VLSNGHAGFGGRSGETHQRKRRQGAPGRPNIAEGKTHKEALRCLKRRISDAVFARLQADARKATATAAAKGPGGQPGNHSVSRAAGSHPEHRLFGQATPGPATTIRPATTAGPAPTQPNEAHRCRAAHSAAASKKSQTTT
jgi:hypothetical protein